MPINTNLSVSPYFDDYDPNGEYYKILFKPAVAVQTRELNQLQTILQNQIEKFGNNIYKRGTIIDGCNFMFYENYPYIKLKDNETDGTPVNPAAYLNQFIKDESTGLTAYVVDYKDGYEATPPDLKTLYVKYINSGLSGNSTAFSAGDTLIVYDANNALNKIVINNGSSGWSNTDTVVIVPALLVNSTSSNVFSNGETITQSTTGSTAVITGIDTTSFDGKIVLRIKPVQADLTDVNVPLTKWSFSENLSIAGGTSNSTAVVIDSIGSGAEAFITTDNINGSIENITITSGGSGYYIAPHITIRQNFFTGGDYNNLNLQAFKYKSQVNISGIANTVGNGYAFGVTGGIIYKNGYFLNVKPQNVIVSKYSNSPNNVSVGFDVIESLIDHNVDESLLDNSTGTPNEMAPGADRLKMTPVLIAVNSATVTTNTEFLSIVEFNEGFPYKQNRTTQYSGINDEMARRTFESAGDYSRDRFQVTTRSPLTTAAEANSISVIIDPGTAYISGYRVETKTNYATDIDKGLDYQTNLNTGLKISYGNYINIREVGGTFAFHTGDAVDLYDTPKGFLSNSSLIQNANTNPVGKKLGTANMRQLLHVAGTPGTNTAVYRLYLFNVKMANGANFLNVKSIYYNGTKKGIADVELVYSTFSNSSTAKLITGIEGNSQLLFPTAVSSSVAANNISYDYRTVNSSLSMTNSSANVSISVSSSPSTVFPYSNNSTLTFNEKNDITLVPLDSHLIITPSLTGTANAQSGNSTVIGNGTLFNDPYQGLMSGDYVYLYSNSTVFDIRKVAIVSNNTTITLDSGPSFTNSVAAISRVFPQNVPIPLSSGAVRDNYVVNVNSSGTTLNIDLNVNLTASGTSNVGASFIARRNGATPDSKSASRNNVVKICLANNVSGAGGPWCLGVPDVFRLRGVYIGSSDSVTTADTEVTDQFYVDHNQNADFYDMSFLYKKNNSYLSLTNGAWLLVVFDAFTGTGTIHTVSSYVSANLNTRVATDTTALSSLTTSINTLEIPEVHTSDGQYYDLIDHLDFRPKVVNSAIYTTDVNSATVNPVYSVAFGSFTDDKKFPIPGSGANYTHSYFLNRYDLVSIGRDNNFTITRGKPAVSRPPMPTMPVNSMPVDLLKICAYPTLPYSRSAFLTEILDTGMANEKFTFRRINNHTVTTNYDAIQFNKFQPMGYSMEAIGNLERRIKALEYYVSLTLLESSIKDLTIPSSISPNINRFKFGFFTDNFETKYFAELNNPEYNASVSNNKLTPKELTTRIVVDPPNLNYESEYLLVQQPLATVTNSVSNTNPIMYYGVVEEINPKYIDIHRHSINHKDHRQEWHGQKISVKIKSLKPNTNHKIFIDDKEVTNLAILENTGDVSNSVAVGVLNGNIQTDKKGRVKFKLLIDIDESVFLPQADPYGGKHKKHITHDPGLKRITLYNTDKTSTAVFSLPPFRIHDKETRRSSSSNGYRSGGGSDRSNVSTDRETWGGASGTDSSRVGETINGQTTWSDGRDYLGN